MQETWSLDLMWWVTAVEMPVLAGLFWLIWRNRRETDQAQTRTRISTESGLVSLRQSLDAYKLDVAKTYASMGYLKDVERRLTGHLIRIEEKLDGVRSHGGRAS